MTLTVWLSLFTICILGAMSPGPSLAMVAKHSLAGDVRTALRLLGLMRSGLGCMPLLP